MMTQSLAPASTKDPLTTSDRQIIATIVNDSDYSKECQPEDVVTIWISADGWHYSLGENDPRLCSIPQRANGTKKSSKLCRISTTAFILLNSEAVKRWVGCDPGRSHHVNKVRLFSIGSKFISLIPSY